MSSDTAMLDIEEALRTLDIVGNLAGKAGHLDMFMKVKGERAGDIEGEALRKFSDGKSRHHILGYYFSGGSPTDVGTGTATGRRRYAAVRVVRNADAASSSLLSAFSTNDKLTVELSSYKAGGTESSQPMFRMELSDARVKTATLLGGGALHGTGAVEIMEFLFRSIVVEAAPQGSTGQRAAVRTFTDSVA